MKKHILLLSFFISLLFYNQAFAREKESNYSSDSTLILQEGLKIALSDTTFISIGSLTTSVKHNKLLLLDSVLLVLHEISKKNLPKLNKLKFKVITEEYACNLASQASSLMVLEMEILSMTDEKARLRIKRTCVSWIDNECRLNFMCGAGLGIELNKKNDNWVGEIKSSWAY
ncbi:hypothetical protein [Rufibacter roseus]|uniref:Uncharacterized protein n=1 Tax=Rufibacter roseus TaxID=1567108 RepID=A0ABW2DEV4_9BACT|nr:hypothetical protein [Rufibacter roseus]